MNKKKTPLDNEAYTKELKELKEKITTHSNKIVVLKQESRSCEENLKNYYIVTIANTYLEIVELSCKINEITEDYKSRKNNNVLNDARKAYFNGLIQLEEITGTFVDTPLYENKEILKSLDKLNPKRVLNLVNKLKSSLEAIMKGYGENSKYKWSFVDMEGRYITIFKNLLDFKKISINDPRDPYYPENVKLSIMIKEGIQNVSSNFREKYMLGSKEVVDIKKAVVFQETLKKIHTILGESHLVELAKKTIDSWNQLLEREEKTKEEKRRKRDLR